MGKNACFAQRRAVFLVTDGQKRLFCPTKGAFPSYGWAKVPVLPNERTCFRVLEPKMAGFGARRCVFSGPGHQKGLLWGTEGRISGLGNPKWHVLGYRGKAEAGAKKGEERDNSRNERGWAEIVSQRIRKFGPEQNGESKAGRPIGQSKRAAAGKAAKNKSKPRNRVFWKANERV
jgi:hypothetical protein